MNQLTQELYNKLGIKLNRAKILSQIILGIIVSTNVSLISIGKTFRGKSLLLSKIRQIQRTLSLELDISMFISLILSWFELKEPLLSIDRTNWRFGSKNINILMIGIVTKQMVIPLAWHLMQKRGNSSEVERILLIEKILKHFKGKNLCVVGDREFIGKTWLSWLVKQDIAFCIRIKKNQYLGYKDRVVQATNLINSSKFTNKTQVYLDKIDQVLNLSGCNLEREQLILISYKVDNPSQIYRMRWGIETLFQNLKGRGFNIENTHITDIVRFNSLLICVSISAILCYKAGNLKAKIKPIKIKNHGRKSYSFFKYGLLEIQNIFYSAFYLSILPLEKLLIKILKLKPRLIHL
jgi:hypothetical protein